ncbi:ATPase PAAT [Osmerus mordax]|uniref:ATPase PAAT n=1 Tax=Osmerus mordax TaxID=8014 RepID=UPI00350FF3DA
MSNTDMSSNAVENGPVLGHASWTCTSQDHQLADIFLPVHINGNTDLSQADRETPKGCAPVLLEQVEEGSPCVITLQCPPQCPAVISSLLVVSEARTVEVYSQSGDYCGTCRGEREASTEQHSAERGPFYRKHMALDCPSRACDVKLLSLGGRTSVAVMRVVLGLRPPEPTAASVPSPGPGPDLGLGLGLGRSIDMERVQSMVQEMGTSLSPGAQSLMDMVQTQQKNQTDVLGGFLPLLMGSGALSALARGTRFPGAPGSMAQPPGTTGPTDPVPPTQNEALSGGDSPGLAFQDGGAGTTPSPSSPTSLANQARLADMMSPFLSGSPGQARGRSLCPLSPDLLPMLQSVCGQVTQLRLDDAAAKEEERKANGPREERGCCRGLEEVLELHLEQMERRLKEHMDQRLDALEVRLQKALLQALPLVTLNQPAKTSSVAPPDHIHPPQTLNGI